MLVDIKARRIGSFRRQPDGDWLMHEHHPDESPCRLASVGVDLEWDEIFGNVDPLQVAEAGVRVDEDPFAAALARAETITRQSPDAVAAAKRLSGPPAWPPSAARCVASAGGS